MIDISRGNDGYHHPASEAELQALVQYAYEQGMKLRVRGAQHSLATSIYTSGYDGVGVPPGDAIDVMLNLYRGVVITPDPGDRSHATVEVEAGCNMGKNPYDPTHSSTWENSLDYKLQRAGYALEDTGGITHQTISGFMSTGSSGGSLTYSFDKNLTRVRLIDGTGRIWDLRRDDPDPAVRDMFFAAGVSMGLLGVISRVWLRVGPDFNIYGTQVTSPTAQAGIDFFGLKNGDPSLPEFFRRAPYTRMMWWPQSGFDRISVWQAARTEPTQGFVSHPYQEMGEDAVLDSLAGTLFYTIIGNLGDISAVPAKLVNWFTHLDEALAGDSDPNACAPLLVGLPKKHTVDDVLARLRGPFETGLTGLATSAPDTFKAVSDQAAGPLAAGRDPAPDALSLPQWLAKLITDFVEHLLRGVLDTKLAQELAGLLKVCLPYLINGILGMFVENETQYFWDSWRCGLPMDNQMDDQLWDTEFTELWIPLDKAPAVMSALDAFYKAGGDPVLAYQRTGAFSCEIYAANESQFWMSPSYGTPVIRIDVLWYGLNADSPAKEFYPRFWELLAPFAYRPHWGKYLGPASSYLKNLPKLAAFLELRARLDPKELFFTTYWKRALGLEPPAEEAARIPARTASSGADIMQCVPTGAFAMAAGTAIVLGVLKVDPGGGDLQLGEGFVTQLDSHHFVANGTYAFDFEGQHYEGTWLTSIASPDGQTWILSETFTGTIAATVTFPATCTQAGTGTATSLTFVPPATTPPQPNVVQTYQNNGPGQRAMIKTLGPLPVFGMVTAFYYNAAYLG